MAGKMFGRYLYANHILETVACPECGRAAVAPRTKPGDRRLSYVMRGIQAYFIADNDSLPTNTTLYCDCDCGSAVPFSEPGDIAFYVDSTLAATSRLAPLFDSAEAAIRFGKRRRDEVGANLFAHASPSYRRHGTVRTNEPTASRSR
jgi:hypothetical protein